MPVIKYTEFVEIQVEVVCDHHPAENATRTYPGCLPSMEVNNIRILIGDREVKDLKELIESILEEHTENFQEWAWDHMGE